MDTRQNYVYELCQTSGNNSNNNIETNSVSDNKNNISSSISSDKVVKAKAGFSTSKKNNKKVKNKKNDVTSSKEKKNVTISSINNFNNSLPVYQKSPVRRVDIHSNYLNFNNVTLENKNMNGNDVETHINNDYLSSALSYKYNMDAGTISQKSIFNSGSILSDNINMIYNANNLNVTYACENDALASLTKKNKTDNITDFINKINNNHNPGFMEHNQCNIQLPYNTFDNSKSIKTMDDSFSKNLLKDKRQTLAENNYSGFLKTKFNTFDERNKKTKKKEVFLDACVKEDKEVYV